MLLAVGALRSIPNESCSDDVEALGVLDCFEQLRVQPFFAFVPASTAGGRFTQASRARGGHLQVLVRWKGKGEDSDTWEDAASLVRATPHPIA